MGPQLGDGGQGGGRRVRLADDFDVRFDLEQLPRRTISWSSMTNTEMARGGDLWRWLCGPGRTGPTRSRFVTPEVLIDSRPAAAAHRTRCGDWEGDLIVGAEDRSAIGALVDRASRHLLLVHLPVNRSAEALREGVFFAHPASPWQRGTNENTNGLLRQYFPKRTEPVCPHPS